MKPDLHTHTTASDGSLSPTALVAQADQEGVSLLAITDHDTTAGLEEAAREASHRKLTLIPGVELSITWENHCFHVVGLGIDPGYAPLSQGLERIRCLRIERAKEIGERLAARNLLDLEAFAKATAGCGMITRTHFARFLVNQGQARTLQAAFDHYLGRGKPGYVKTRWAPLNEALRWITGAGGVAVLAHPHRYKLGKKAMHRFLTDFQAGGGRGIELVCGTSNDNDIRNACRWAIRFGLSGSVGSDFHGADKPWIRLGGLRPFPCSDITPVWKRWLPGARLQPMLPAMKRMQA